jgi:hypothetical protein
LFDPLSDPLAEKRVHALRGFGGGLLLEMSVEVHRHTQLVE